jgi:predicted dehydrogenase
LALAIVGCGGIAKAYDLAVERDGGFGVVATVDRDPARADAIGAPHQAHIAADLDALLATGVHVDAALVLTPPDTHEALSCSLLAHGIHVLCEKPLAPTTAAAERMMACASAHSRLLMMGSKFRYTPDVARARELLDRGLLGQIALFENTFCTRVDMTQRWNSVRHVAGGGVLIDNGCHSVDIARFLLGPIARVQALFGKPIQKLEVEDTVRLMFESQSGAMGSIDLSWSLHKEDACYVRLYGSRGTMEIGWRQSRYKLEGESAWTEFGSGYDKIAAFAAQLTDFRESLLGRKTPVISEQDALASVQVLDAAYRSAREQKWHELQPSAPHHRTAP